MITAELPALEAQCGDAADSYFRSHYNLIAGQYRVEVGREILASAITARIKPRTQAGVLEKESWGRNIFGCDHGPVDGPPWSR